MPWIWTRTRPPVIRSGCARSRRRCTNFADDVSEVLRLVKGMAGEGTLTEWAGKTATVFEEEFPGA